MTKRLAASGVWTALVTPFTASGEFDASAYAQLLDYQLGSGVTGLVPCGTTGESPTLSWEEHGAAVALAVRRAQGRALVMAGTGSNNTAEAIDGARDAWSRGADAALLVDCYYNGPSSLELRTEYYERVLEAVPELPLVPYVIPTRTGCALLAEDLALLHHLDPVRIPAVKSATGDVSRMRQDRALAGPALSILSGDDDMTLTMMRDESIGATGVISVMSNILPQAIRDMCDQACTDAGVELARQLAPLFQCVGVTVESTRILPSGRAVTVQDRFRNPAAVKTMMAGLGMLQPVMRRPLGCMTQAAVQRCRTALATVYESRPEWFEPIEAAFDVQVGRRLRDDEIWRALGR